jgi:hypothetical protein
MTKAHFEKQIYIWLNNNEIRALLETNGNLVNIAFHHFIRWYPQISDNGLDTYSLNYIDKIRNWEISERAIIAFQDKLKQIIGRPSRSQLNQALKDSTHPEHNISVDLKKRQLLNLETPNLKSVINCLNDGYKVILLSKDERNVLNGNPRNEYILDGRIELGRGMRVIGSYEERLNKIGASVFNQQSKDKFIRKLLEGIME